MKMYRFLVSILIIVFSTAYVSAGPTIIRDGRITDTAMTPVLGRGYSVGTNTFQSTCMQDVITTEPSYDLVYTFESMKSKSSTDSTRARQTSNTSEVGRTTSSNNSSSYRGWGIKKSSSSQYRTAYKRKVARSGSSRVTEKGTSYKHIIEVNVNLISYYASVDEAQSILSQSASNLLQSRDIIGFFSSCGPYYVRSIGREATFLSFFEYETTTTERDTAFESTLESQIKGFRSVARQSSRGSNWFGRSRSNSNSTDRTDFSYSASDKSQSTFNSKAENKNLTITSYAFGLGISEDAQVLSFDIGSFKRAIGDAFKSMQNARTGKVINMEVVPWVENTQFQNLIELEQEADEYEPVLDAAGQPVLDAEGNPTQRLKPAVMLYEKKMLLNENAEFIIEIDRVDRNIMNMYYKAKLCRRNIEANWKRGRELKEEYVGALIQNKRYLDKTIPIETLDEVVSNENVNAIYDTHKTFMYGTDKKKAGGASVCMNEIMKKGIFKVSYRAIESCQPVIQNMGEIQNEVIENYCMPELAD
ncbi:MAG: hypothetical protein HOC24_12615 [Deltaproteobacteria bacterium]|nr:hypothetical protein [Deltaproteobacteria bacterium]